VAGVVSLVLASKVRVPRRRQEAVARPRLVGRVGRGARLTLVSAPAGFGKTTLVTESLAEAGGPAVAWVSLDERDNDPGTF
jgi:LuxR family maltose regulon positive regulatory protein